MDPLLVELNTLCSIARMFQSVLENSKTERVFKLKFERSVEKLQALGLDAGGIYAVLHDAGLIQYLPSNMEWRKPQGIPLPLK